MDKGHKDIQPRRIELKEAGEGRVRLDQGGFTLAVDPGLTGTGWAVFQGAFLLKHGVLTASYGDEEGEWTRGAKQIAVNLKKHMLITPPDNLVIEWVDYRATAKGHASAAEGDLFKLSFLIGMISSVFAKVDPILVTAMEWKGQLSKSLVVERLERSYDIVYKNHEADAVGLGTVMTLRWAGVIKEGQRLENIPRLRGKGGGA